MPIDSSIYFQQQTPDFAGAIEGGMRMADLTKKRRMESAAEDAFKNNMTVGADGKVTQNREGLLRDLTKSGNYREAMAADERFRNQDAASLKQQKDRTDRLYQIVSSAKDQASYQSALGMAAKEGLDVSQMPPQFDQGLVGQYERTLFTAKERADMAWREAQAIEDQKNKDRDYGLKKKELGIKAKKAQGSGEGLPLDVKKTVETLATKNAGKISIKNQIDAALSDWDQLSPDQQLARGRQLLKTLNSTEGADAIAKEEAERLGSKLEFAYGNLTNSNPTQFGRDIEGFRKQAELVSNSIGTAVESNRGEIDRMMGRPSKTTGKTFKTSEIEWVD